MIHLFRYPETVSGSWKNIHRRLLGALPALLIFFAGTTLIAESADSALLRSRLGNATSPASGRLKQIHNRGRIIIGVQKNYQPLTIDDPVESMQGIDIEIAEILGEALGVEVEYRYYSLIDLMVAAAKGDVDVAMGGISSSLARGRYLSFADPYIVTTPAALLSRRVLPAESEAVDFPRERIKSLSDLRNLGKIRIGVKSGTTNEQILKSDPEFRIHSIESFSDRKELLTALLDGHIDALVGDGINLKALTLKQSGLLTRFLYLGDTYREEHLSMAIQRGESDLLIYLNFFIKEIRRTGKLHEITARYLETDDWVK